jgi:hypothetical protein
MPLFEPDSDFATGPDVPNGPEEPILDIDDIQGVVLPGFGTSRQHVLGVRFPDAGGALRWLGRWSSAVSTLQQANGGRNRRRGAMRLDQPRPITPLWMGLALSADALLLLLLLSLPSEELGRRRGVQRRAGGSCRTAWRSAYRRRKPRYLGGRRDR